MVATDTPSTAPSPHLNRRRAYVILFVTTCVAATIVALSVTLTNGSPTQNGQNESGATTTPETPAPNNRSPKPPAVEGTDDDQCGQVTSVCSFVENFSTWNQSRWNASDGYVNGPAFGVWWDSKQVQIGPEHLTLSLTRSYHLDRSYASGQLASTVWFQYGCFEASIKPPDKIGYVVTLHSYLPSTPISTFPSRMCLNSLTIFLTISYYWISVIVFHSSLRCCHYCGNNQSCSRLLFIYR